MGDGRALLLGEVVDKNGSRFDIQLKGSGKTTYSRNGDGKSALGPVLREYIVSEAMSALGIPTTRALAAVATGEKVVRTKPLAGAMMQTEHLPGGVFTRVASSHIRVGTFQYFAARKQIDNIKKLANYSIARHYPKIRQELKEADSLYLSFFAAICNAQASLVAQWMCVGFIHGVMNTDNMTISGETIDYGPCAFMDYYAADTVFSSIDKHGRYAYHNQPSIAQWNLARLAEALLPIFGEDTEQAIAHNIDQNIEKATEILEAFPEQYTQYWLSSMRKKIGLQTEEDDDLALANDLLASLVDQQVDYTLLFRHLADVLQGEESLAYELFNEAAAFKLWVAQWKDRLDRDALNISESIELMNHVNPIYIPRNHKVEETIEAAVADEDYSNFEILIDTLSKPYQLQDGKDEYSQAAPEKFGATFQTFCGT